MTRIPLRDVREVVSPLSEHVLLSDEVAAALAAAQPVVALETSLVTHGLPLPHCVDVSMDAAGRIRAGGAVPAVIAVSDGHMVVGLSHNEVDQLARARDTVKATRANLSAVIARRQTGGTTVSATMLIANACGIDVFSTGGLGGVHRGAAGDVRRSLSGTLDISADLEELSRTPVNVVCAGPKIILDVQLTLEYLETNGVPLMTLGADEVPGFYTRSSGAPTPLRVDDIGEAAAIIATQRALGLTAGTVTCVPLATEDAVGLPIVESAIDRALDEAGPEIRGGAVTPYLLERLHTITGGATLRANLKLIGNNAEVAAALAVALRDFVMTDELAARARQAGWLHTSGAVMSDEPARSTALALMEVARARAAGVPVHRPWVDGGGASRRRTTSLDLNIRTSDGRLPRTISRASVLGLRTPRSSSARSPRSCPPWPVAPRPRRTSPRSPATARSRWVGWVPGGRSWPCRAPTASLSRSSMPATSRW